MVNETLSETPGGATSGHPELETLARIIRSRRTSMLVDRDREVPLHLVERLCELAQWAPNHKRTWPWRFSLVVGEGRAALGATIAGAMEAHGDPIEKVTKTRTKYLRTPATLVVGSAAGDTPHRTAENRDAVAAGIQNLLLAATTMGLATYWGSCPDGSHAPVSELCSFPADTHISALLYLGWAAGNVEAPVRPAVDLNIVDR